MTHVLKATNLALCEAVQRLADGGIIVYGCDSNSITDLTQTPIAILREGPVGLEYVMKLIAKHVTIPTTS